MTGDTTSATETDQVGVRDSAILEIGRALGLRYDGHMSPSEWYEAVRARAVFLAAERSDHATGFLHDDNCSTCRSHRREMRTRITEEPMTRPRLWIEGVQPRVDTHAANSTVRGRGLRARVRDIERRLARLEAP